MITLKNKRIKIVIAPDMGMALLDFSIDNISILNQKLKSDFYKTRKGLGPVIFPHFNQASLVTFDIINRSDKIYKLFPHIKYLQKLGISHPFQHGVGRYVPWNFKVNKNSLTGILSGDDEFGNIKLKKLNGFDFKSKIVYILNEDNLVIKYEVLGEKPIATGIHFYYDLIDTKSLIHLNAYRHDGTKIENMFLNKDHNEILCPVADKDGFSYCLLQTSKYDLLTKILTKGNSHKIFESIIIFSDIKKKFVCIEPISYKILERNTKLEHFSEIKLVPKSKI